MEDPRLEPLAQLAHEQWSGWMKYLFSKCEMRHFHEHGEYRVEMVIPAEFVERWKRQMNTSYEELSEQEKESDRVEAQKVLVFLEENK